MHMENIAKELERWRRR